MLITFGVYKFSDLFSKNEHFNNQKAPTIFYKIDSSRFYNIVQCDKCNNKSNNKSSNIYYENDVL